jgi:hypothetical protein
MKKRVEIKTVFTPETLMRLLLEMDDPYKRATLWKITNIYSDLDIYYKTNEIYEFRKFSTTLDGNLKLLCKQNRISN